MGAPWSVIGHLLEVALEVVEVARPHAPVRRQPRVEVTQRTGVDAVQPALGAGAHLDEARLAQYRRCLDTAGWLSSSSSTRSPAGRSDPRTRSGIRPRVGSASTV